MRNYLRINIIICYFVTRNYCLNAKNILTTKAKNRKKLIVSLITSDLIHAKLLAGLEQMGLHPENYYLYLSDHIIELMGFEGEQGEYLFRYYDDLKKRAEFIDNSKDNREMKKLARDIYHNLQLQQPLETE